jgi:hypothetical protein
MSGFWAGQEPESAMSVVGGLACAACHLFCNRAGEGAAAPHPADQGYPGPTARTKTNVCGVAARCVLTRGCAGCWSRVGGALLRVVRVVGSAEHGMCPPCRCRLRRPRPNVKIPCTSLVSSRRISWQRADRQVAPRLPSCYNGTSSSSSSFSQ